MLRHFFLAVLPLLLLGGLARGQYSEWQHAGSLIILTTPDGADLPATAKEEGFPLLVRLDKEWFDFSQAKPKGEDIRFSSAGGASLAYQIDQWDPSQGTACIWVRIPTIQGNARQEIKMHWGNAGAASESSGTAVFNATNGYASVFHMDGPVHDELGTASVKDVATSATPGMIGEARHFVYGRTGILQDKPITGYPIGASPNSFEAWFRPDPHGGIVLSRGGNWAAGRAIIGFSPIAINVDCYACGVQGKHRLPVDRWLHVIHTYQNGESRVYINGQLDNSARHELNMPDKGWLGMGCYAGNLGLYAGDIDEVRVSNVARTADWIKLQYDNQKPLQTVVGPLVQPGKEFSTSTKKITVLEGKSAEVSAKAGGAQKIYWIVKRGSDETIAAVDRFHFKFDAGRVSGDQSLILQFKAIYPNEARTLDIPVTIQEDIPEPVFALKAPAQWDGRKTIELTPEIANRSAMQAKGAGQLEYDWRLPSNLAVISSIEPGKLILKRAQNSGTLEVTLAISNGGPETTQTVKLAIQEPAQADAWAQRVPDKDEKPVDNEFYARDDKNKATLFYNGALAEAADSVFLKIYAGDQLYHSESQKLPANRAYAFSAALKPGFVKYRVEFGSKTGDHETIRQTVNNVVCGDAFLIDGQSNAVATEADNPYSNEWIRSFGNRWGEASCRGGGNKVGIGYWAVDLARHLMETYKTPICIINGAVGGTIIESHQRNPKNPADGETIYGRLLHRVQQARLTHGMRAVFWHQGENDQGSAGSTGRYGWETYQRFFIDMSAGWKEDYPNIQHYYVFQIWPNSCMMGVNVSGDMLREEQRTLPRLYSNLSIVATLGIKPAGGCHYPAAGYAAMARLIGDMVEKYSYGKAFPGAVTSPNLQRAAYTGDKHDEIALEFDQPMLWNPLATKELYLDEAAGKVASGAVSGKRITLKLASASAAKQMTYVVGKSWNQDNLLSGENGLPALTFCNVLIESAK